MFLRWWDNQDALNRAILTRGQYFFGTAAGSSSIALDGHLARFAVLPVLDWYFDRMLALLAERRIAVDFVAMPMNEATWRAVRPELATGFAAYLSHYAAKYSNFHVVGAVMPHWPDRLFGNSFAHLNPEGTALFSEKFARWLDRPRPAARELLSQNRRHPVHCPPCQPGIHRSPHNPVPTQPG